MAISFINGGRTEKGSGASLDEIARIAGVGARTLYREPEEVAGAVVWLCTSAASFMIGHAVAVDGGVLAG